MTIYLESKRIEDSALIFHNTYSSESKKMLNRNIFPIEIIKRELDYKMLLACLILEKNQEAIIGQHDRIEKIMLKSNNGIYIGKNIMKY